MTVTNTTPACTLREPCGRAWTDELVNFSFTWAPGAQPDVSLHYTRAGAPLPTQLTGVTRHPDGSLAGATAWCRLALAPEETVSLQLTPGAGPAHPDRPCWQPQADGTVVVENALFAVRLPADGCYPAAAVPGPLLAVCIDGAWLGAGRVEASRPVHIATELLEQGPLFLRWRTRLYYEARTLATMECTLYAGEDFVHIRELTSRDSDMTFRFNCLPGLTPDRLLTKGGGEHLAQQVRELDYARPETLATVDFHSGHHQMSLSWYGVYRDGAAPFLGVVQLHSAAWTHTSVNRLPLRITPPEALEICSPLQGGVKEWALVCSTVARNLQAPGQRVPNHLSRIHTRYAEIPLQKVKDWVLDWAPETLARPFLQCDADGIARARARVLYNRDLQRVYREWTAALAASKRISSSRASMLATLWVALGEDRFAQDAVGALEAEVRQHLDIIWAEGLLMRMIIFDGRQMKLWLQAYDVLAAGGFISAEVDRRLRRDLAFLAYAMADPEFFPKQYNLADHNDPDSYFHGLGQTIGDTQCPPNFHTEYYTTYGMMGCCFRNHPLAATWRREAAALMDRQLEVHFYDSGAYCESPNYHAHGFVMMNQLALALRRAGERDFYQHPRFKAQFDYFCQMQTPPIRLNADAQHFTTPTQMLNPARERYALLPGNGNSGHNCSDMPLPIELAVGAAIYRESDPALSARCMTTWRRGGRRVVNHYDDLTFLLCADPDLPGVETVGTHSALLTGAYATFRANPETADEVFVLTKNGTATHHNDFDEGGFTIWAYGAPIASDFGYHAEHAGRNCGVGETWKHNCVEFDGNSSGFLGIEQTSPPEQWVSSPLADLLVSYLPITNLRGYEVPMTYMDQIPIARIEYRRFTLFVKPGYLLIFDSIQSCKYAHRWWLHAQATDIAVDGPRARFTGAFGVDLLAHFITPAQPRITTGEWSVMKHLHAVQALNNDWRVFVAPVKPGQDFAVSSTLGGRVTMVETPEYRDTLLLAHFPFRYEDATLTFHGRAAVARTWRDGRPTEVSLLDGQELQVK